MDFPAAMTSRAVRLDVAVAVRWPRPEKRKPAPEEHARNAALAIRQVVVSESAQAAAAVAADVKKAVNGGKKR